MNDRMIRALRMVFGGVCILIVIALASWPWPPAAAQAAPVSLPGTQVRLFAGPAAPVRQRAPQLRLAPTQTAPATIHVTYTGFPAAAQTAFQAAAAIWATQISSPVVIEVAATWTSLDAGVLGAAGPQRFVRDFAGAPRTHTWYPIALANRLAGTDLRTNEADITAQFNSSFAQWYFGTDGQPPANTYDFETVVLHELGHGLGFLGSMTVSSGQGSWGANTSYPYIFDQFAVNGGGQALLDTQLFPNPSTALATQLTSDACYFNGTNAVAAAGGNAPKLYTPSTWQTGSSYSHLDETTYGAATANALLTPILDSGEGIHDPGPIARGILADLGWLVQAPVATATPSPTPVVPSPTPTSPAPSPTSAPVGGVTPVPPATDRWQYLPLLTNGG